MHEPGPRTAETTGLPLTGWRHESVRANRCHSAFAKRRPSEARECDERACGSSVTARRPGSIPWPGRERCRRGPGRRRGSTIGRPDLALVVNDGPAHAAAGVFTRNKVKAAPVLWTQQVLTTGRLRAVVLNSGGANACTGPRGLPDAHATAEKVGRGARVRRDRGGVCSTGLIGEAAAGRPCSPGSTPPPGARRRRRRRARRGHRVMTTDTVPKQAAFTDATGGASAASPRAPA